LKQVDPSGFVVGLVGFPPDEPTRGRERTKPAHSWNFIWWTVAKLDLEVKAQEIVVIVEHPRGSKLWCYDHAEERRWRHSFP
jgi:hypothetical protein